MATLNVNYPTYADIARRTDPDGTLASIMEILAEDNPIVSDGMVIEANGVSTHRSTVRTGLPTGTWRMLNYGVGNEKSRTAQITDQLGMLESYAEVDKTLAELNGNSAAWRLSEDKAFLEGMSQTVADTVVYGNVSGANPSAFVGLTPRFNALSGYAAAQNVVNAAGSNANAQMSLWFVTWGEDTVHLLHPKGIPAGFQHEDLGQETLFDAVGGKYEGYRTHYSWDVGLCVRDWRYVARLCNIDTANLIAGSYTALIDDMTKAMWRLKTVKPGKTVIYANRTLLTYLDILVQGKANLHLNYQDWAGERVLAFRGIPIRQTDALLETEAVVS